MINRDEVKRLKEKYPAGTRIELLYMADEQAVSPGSKGTVKMVDDMGTIHMKWDNGRSLGLVYGEDNFKVIRSE